MDDVNKNRILVCPLGWGLGHASRMIPIISRFQQFGFEVIVAGDELQMHYIKSHFLNIKTVDFPSFKVKFAKGSNQLLPLLKIALMLPLHTIREHYTLKKIIGKYKVDIIISDNRYGLWCKGITSIFITHQLRVLFPKPFRFLESVGVWFIRRISNKFTFIWIPDYSGERNISGKLSHPKKLPSNARYIGLLSRFQKIKVDAEPHKWDLVGVASGPSPQREIFIELVCKLSKQHSLKTLIIKGNPKEGNKVFDENGISYAGHLNDTEFASAVISSKYLITRSGYSTIMDLVSLGITGLIVPTPGQTEQEYLAKYLSERGIFRTCNQENMEDIYIEKLSVMTINSNKTEEFLEKAFQELFLSLK